jgi:uncharacterized protein (UPF0261 family)
MSRVIVVTATLDTKWREAGFLRSEIEAEGYRTLLMDIGMRGNPGIVANITREQLISAAGHDPEEFARIDDRAKLMQIITAGATKKMHELYSSGNLGGIISIGGTTGTQMGTTIMKSLPFGLPKFALSSTASLRGLAARYIETADITLMHSVVEIIGLDDLVRNAIARAAKAVCAMVEANMKSPVSARKPGEKPLIALTTFRPTEKCATMVRSQLEEQGYQVIGFSAAGIGDKAMEEMIERENVFGAVVDLAPGGVGEELLKFDRAAGPTRLEAAGKAGIPQVIAPGGVNWGSPLKSRYKPEYYSRKIYDVDALRAFVKLSQDEMVMVADAMADKLNKARGPVKFLIPLGGWSSVDPRGTELYEPEIDRAFTEELKKRLRRDIEVREIDADFETPEFAQAVVQAFNEVMGS